MKMALMGWVAGAAMVLGVTAYADDATMGSSSSTMEKTTKSTDSSLSNELTGRVVKVSTSEVWLEHMGAIIPLKVDQNTRFESASIKRAKDLKEGQEIRASFTIANRTDNLAKTITLASGMGGSGDVNSNLPSNPQPMQNDQQNAPKSY